MLQFAKMQPSRIEDLRKGLTAAGYYDDKPIDLRAMPDILRRGDTQSRLERIVAGLAGYTGPVTFDETTQKLRSRPLSLERIRDWLRQFRDDPFISIALKALESLVVIDRARANDVLNRYLANHEDLRGCSVVPLGDPKDSSSALTYLVGDAAAQHGCVLRSLTGGLAHDRRLLMLDDFVGQGSGSITILEGWMGVDDSQDLHQEPPKELSEHEKELMRAANIHVLFASGRSAGARALEERAAELGISMTVHVDEMRLPTLDGLEVDGSDMDAFKDFCRLRAEEVFRAQGRQADWYDGRLLGYGDEGLLLLSAFNTPTATVSCFWNGLEADGHWQALFPRRPKT